MVEVLWGRGGIVVIEGWQFELEVEADTFCSGGGGEGGCDDDDGGGGGG